MARRNRPLANPKDKRCSNRQASNMGARTQEGEIALNGFAGMHYPLLIHLKEGNPVIGILRIIWSPSSMSYTTCARDGVGRCDSCHTGSAVRSACDRSFTGMRLVRCGGRAPMPTREPPRDHDNRGAVA